MRILGIDPGYAIVGWGVIRYQAGTPSPLGFGALTTGADLPFEERLRVIYQDLDVVLDRYRPDVMAIEQLFFHTNQKTAIAVAQARGVLVLAATLRGIPVFEYTPLQVKQSVVGYGKAVKSQVMEMTRTLLRLEQVPRPDDTADALAIAICHAHSYNSRLTETAGRRIK